VAQRDTRALVAHLFRRAGFGLRPDELDRFTSLGVQGSVEYLINYARIADPADSLYPPPDLSQDYMPPVPTAQRTAATQKQVGMGRARAKLAIQEWWVNRMLHTARPLQEKMTLFWHGHFATALTKAPAPLMVQQNQLFRAMSLGNFNALLKAVNQDPAMLLWLDGATNRAGKPNENFSRELMELFTIGVGNYTEQDVREGARALTGWTFRRGAYQQILSGGTVQARFVPRFHDSGTKTYLGHTGNLGSDDVMNILSSHTHAGPFLARKLFEFFAYDGPDTATIQPLLDAYYHSGYDISTVMRTLLLSDAFYSDQSFQQHFKSPVEFVVGTVRELDASVPTQALVRAMTLMGQDLFNPPNVGGWPGGITWINASALVERFNFAGMLTGRFAAQPGMQAAGTSGSAQPAEAGMIRGLNPEQLVMQSGARDVAGLVDYLLSRFIGIGATPTTQAALLEYLGGNGILTSQSVQSMARGLLQLVLSTPEYQLN
jgi:uncharacterized protein (DUF1800 family)